MRLDRKARVTEVMAANEAQISHTMAVASAQNMSRVVRQSRSPVRTTVVHQSPSRVANITHVLPQMQVDRGVAMQVGSVGS